MASSGALIGQSRQALSDACTDLSGLILHAAAWSHGWHASERRQAAARRQDPTVTAMRRRSQLGVKELESELPAYCSEAVGLYFFYLYIS